MNKRPMNCGGGFGGNVVKTGLLNAQGATSNAFQKARSLSEIVKGHPKPKKKQGGKVYKKTLNRIKRTYR